MTAPVLDPAVVTLGYAAQQQAARACIAGYLSALWASLSSWRSADADRFASQAAPLVTGAQQHTATLAAAYLAQLLRSGGITPGAMTLDGFDDTALRGVAATDVYRRPFQQLWWDLSQGKPLDKAVSAAGARVQSLAGTDIQLAKTHASQRVMAATPATVTGYRRVLTGDHSCALCVLACSRTYHKGELLPIHPGCDCAVAPLFDGEQAPDLAADVHTIIASDLGERYVSASGTSGPADYRRIVVTHQHGELGPVLGVAGQGFTGPGDIPRG